MEVRNPNVVKKTVSEAERAWCQSILFLPAPSVGLLQRQAADYALASPARLRRDQARRRSESCRTE